MDYKTTLYRNDEADAYEVHIEVTHDTEEVWYSRFSGQEVSFPDGVRRSLVWKLDAEENRTNEPVSAELIAELENEALEEFCKTLEGAPRYGKRLRESL